MPNKSIFISYSHKDSEWKDRLVTHLKVIESETNITIWDDSKIEIGKDWLTEIEKQLESANIAIMLISADYLISNFIKQKEIPTILKRHEKEGLVLLPFILKPCSWKTIAWLSKVQALPKDGVPLIQGNEYQIENDLSIVTNVIFRILFPINPSQKSNIFNLGNVDKVNDINRNKEIIKFKQRGRPRKAKMFVSPDGVLQVVNGNNNIQIAGNVNNYLKPAAKYILPPPNSIGSDVFLKQAIITLFNKIGDEREKRYPGTGRIVFIKNFKSDFEIKDNKWTIIWTYPIECASTIIDYLKNKYSNTIRGRKENAWSKGNYIPPRNIMYAEESKFLDHLGLTTKSDEVRDMLNRFFNIKSHTQLTTNQHWQFVKYLENIVKSKYE